MTYDYNASALALGGVLNYGDGTTVDIPSLASVHLAPTGGLGEAKVLGYNQHGVSFAVAYSTVTGTVTGQSTGDQTFTTGSRVYVADLNLFGRIQVAYMETKITSMRTVFATAAINTQDDPDSVQFSMQSKIVGLVIDGIEVIPQFDGALMGCMTYAAFRNQIDTGGVAAYAEQFSVSETQLEDVLKAEVQPIRGSFVETLETPAVGPRRGFRLPVKKFGYVHLGELVVKPGHRRVNLLRIEFNPDPAADPNSVIAGIAPVSASLSSPNGGSMTILSQMTNGAPSWP